MKESQVFLSIGSNLGDREQNIYICLNELREISNVENISSIFETEPFKVKIKQDNFLNLVVEIKYKKTPKELLKQINDIESDLGRLRTEMRNEPRKIDIDIIFFESLILKEKNLVVPHPRFRERLFVLEPLNEIAPTFVDPITKKLVKDLLIHAQNSSN